ncbi:MAG: hypothetical protein NTV51_00135, partial [Verrucomicrobia bacterium]|nr:hypothetical protein [Verrucomicrobiota bacterium]
MTGFATGVVLAVTDAGSHAGVSNAFDVTSGPLHHFAWSTIPASIAVDTPLAVSVTAQDIGNNTVPYNGTINLGLRSPSVVEVLSWTAYSDTSSSGEYENAKRAITTYFPNYHETSTATTDAATLATLLAGKHVFLVPEQELVPSGMMGSLGTTWAGVLANFVNGGGTVIVCSWTTDEHLLLVNSGLMTATKGSVPSSLSVTKSSDTPLNAGVTTPFDGSYISTYTGINGVVSLQSASDGNPVVFSRNIGPGRVIVIGTDYFTIGTDMDRILANAVSTSSSISAGLVPVRPANAALVGGVWSGSLSVPITGAGLKLSAAPAGGSPEGLSTAFNATAVLPPTTTDNVFAEDFESGVLSGAWTVSGTGTYRTQIATANGPHGGSHHLTMDNTSGGAANARNEATLTLNLAGRTGVLLSFWAKMFDDDPDGPPASPFTGGADFDGVAISADGTNWYEVQPLRTPALTNNWAQFTINLDAALAARGLNYTSAFKIRFNQYDNYEIPTDGIAIDDLVVTATVVGSAVALALPPQATEAATGITGSLTLPAATAASTTFTLASSAPAKLTVPATVVVPAGQTTVTFAVTLPDDTLVDGNRLVTVTATATGYQAANASVTVIDNDTATLALSVPATATEGDAPKTATLTLSAIPAGPVSVTLSSSVPARATVPATITFSPGQSTATFPIAIVNDGIINGSQAVTVTAAVAGWTSATGTITVQDDESTSLAVIIPASLREGDAPKTGSVRLNGVLTTNLVVALNSSDPTAVTVPASVTISAGQNSADFTLTIIDDTVADGPQPFVLTATASGFTTGTANGTVRDNEAHHFSFATIGSPQVSNGPLPLIITARDAANGVVTDYNSPVTLTASGSSGPLTVLPGTVTGFVNGIWNGTAQINALATGVVINASDGAGHTGASNAFALATGSLDHFAWNPISSPQILDTPFAVTLRAVDIGGGTVTTFNGLANLSFVYPALGLPTGVGT